MFVPLSILMFFIKIKSIVLVLLKYLKLILLRNFFYYNQITGACFIEIFKIEYILKIDHYFIVMQWEK